MSIEPKKVQNSSTPIYEFYVQCNNIYIDKKLMARILRLVFSIWP